MTLIIVGAIAIVLGVSVYYFEYTWEPFKRERQKEKENDIKRMAGTIKLSNRCRGLEIRVLELESQLHQLKSKKRRKK